MNDTKKYYWLKLKRDFFKRHDITVIEAMPNGDKYLLFYLKLLVESIDHEGALRFSDTIPYNDAMLSAITHTDIDIVRSAVKVFQQFGMMDVMDDGTLYMKQVNTMIGDETAWAEKKRIYREKQVGVETSEGQKGTMSDKRLDKEIDKEIDKDNNTIISTDKRFSFDPNDIAGSFEKVRTHWNSKTGLPTFSRLFMNLFPKERDSFMVMLSHGVDALCLAIDHYSILLSDPVKYGFDVRYAYKSFPGFLQKAENYLEEPKARASPEAKPVKDYTKYNALMRKE